MKTVMQFCAVHNLEYANLRTHSIKREASVSPDIQKNLAPYAATLTHSKDRVFKESEVSQTADIEHLQDFEKDVKALLQETLWFLNMHKVSSENEQSLREAVNTVESRMRRVLTIDLSACVSRIYCSFLPNYTIYSGTSLLRTPSEPHKVS